MILILSVSGVALPGLFTEGRGLGVLETRLRERGKKTAFQKNLEKLKRIFTFRLLQSLERLFQL